jgi:hypothetical protein
MEKIQLKEEWIIYAYTVSHYDIYNFPACIGNLIETSCYEFICLKKGKYEGETRCRFVSNCK